MAASSTTRMPGALTPAGAAGMPAAALVPAGVTPGVPEPPGVPVPPGVLALPAVPALREGRPGPATPPPHVVPRAAAVEFVLPQRLQPLGHQPQGPGVERLGAPGSPSPGVVGAPGLLEALEAGPGLETGSPPALRHQPKSPHSRGFSVCGSPLFLWLRGGRVAGRHPRTRGSTRSSKR